jgi:hypothetical protein
MGGEKGKGPTRRGQPGAWRGAGLKGQTRILSLCPSSAPRPRGAPTFEPGLYLSVCHVHATSAEGISTTGLRLVGLGFARGVTLKILTTSKATGPSARAGRVRCAAARGGGAGGLGCMLGTSSLWLGANQGATTGNLQPAVRPHGNIPAERSYCQYR